MLTINQLQKNYDAFHLNCTLKVRSGCITGLVGANGSGKSTTFKSILGLIRPDSGEIKIFGKNADSLSIQDKEKIGVVLSDSGFSGWLTVKDVISIMKSMYPTFNRNTFVARCGRLQLPFDKKLKDFSTGMKAKLKILIALSHQTDLLILDEPTSGLDVIARDELLNLLREYMEEDDSRSILISSHISSDLEGLCDELYMIHDGNILWHEETDTLLTEYGLLKVSEQQYEKLDKQYLLRVKKEPYGYSCLTAEKKFYEENYPGITVEKGNIDEMITMMVKGSLPVPSGDIRHTAAAQSHSHAAGQSEKHVR